jgi:type IV pilus assembly protein PilO
MSALDSFAKMPLSRKVVGAMVLLVLGGVVYYFARYQSLSSDNDRLVRQHYKLQSQERQFIEKRDSYEADVRRLSQLREAFVAQSRILPPDAEMSTFLESLNNHGELAGLEIALVQPLDEEGVGFYAKIPVELHLRGRYHEVAKFFYNVSRLERVINIENISFRPRTEGSSSETDSGGDTEAIILDVRVLATTFRALEDQASEGTNEGGG